MLNRDHQIAWCGIINYVAHTKNVQIFGAIVILDYIFIHARADSFLVSSSFTLAYIPIPYLSTRTVRSMPVNADICPLPIYLSIPAYIAADRNCIWFTIVISCSLLITIT